MTSVQVVVIVPTVVVGYLDEIEMGICITEIAREVIIVQAIVSNGCVVLWIARVSQVDATIDDTPIETVTEALIRTDITIGIGHVAVPVHLIAIAVAGIVVVRIEDEIGVVRVELVIESVRVGVAIVHTEIALPLSRNCHGDFGVGIFVTRSEHRAETYHCNDVEKRKCFFHNDDVFNGDKSLNEITVLQIC